MPKGPEHYDVFRNDLRSCTNKFTRRRSSLKGLMDHMWQSRDAPLAFDDRADALKYCVNTADPRIVKYHGAIDRMVTCWGTEKPYPATVENKLGALAEQEAGQHANAVLEAYEKHYLPTMKKGLTMGDLVLTPEQDQDLGVIAQREDQFIVLLGEQHSTETVMPLKKYEKQLMIAGAKAVVAAIGQGGAQHATFAAVELPASTDGGATILGSRAGLPERQAKLTIKTDADEHLGSINHSLFYYRGELLGGVVFVEGEDTADVFRRGLAALSDERNPGIAEHLVEAAESEKMASVTVLPVGLSHLGGRSVQWLLGQKGWNLVKQIN